jgi:hypothetical protein
MSSGNYDLYINRNTDYNKKFTYYNPDGVTPINLTGYSFQGQIKVNPKSIALIDIDISVPTPANGEIFINVEKALAETLLETGCNSKVNYYEYDIIVTYPNTEMEVFLDGKVFVKDGVTEWKSP